MVNSVDVSYFFVKIMIKKKKHDKRLFNSAITAINMDRQGIDNYGNNQSSCFK